MRSRTEERAAKQAAHRQAEEARAKRIREDRRRAKEQHDARNAAALQREAEGPDALAREAQAARLDRAVTRAYGRRIAGVRPPDYSNVPPGGCGPNTNRCRDARDYTLERRPCCTAINREILRFTVDVLNAMGITYWADYGTLLGAVRHGGFIPWDKDSDLGILQEDVQRLLYLESDLKRQGIGFSGRKNGTIKFFASPRNESNTDIFAWHVRDKRYVRHTYASVDDFKGKAFPVDWLFPLTTVQYDGLELKAPAAVRFPGKTPAPNVPGFEQGSAFLEHRYGPGWMHPIRANNDGVRR